MAPCASVSKWIVYVSYTWIRRWECQTTYYMDGISGGGGFKDLLGMFTLNIGDRLSNLT